MSQITFLSIEVDMPSFLVGYDYGMGGLWGFVDAPSEEEIKKIYPELKIAHERPSWMTDSIYEKIRARGLYDIYGPPVGILKAVVGERAKTAPKWRMHDIGR
jgi:hypothetical protein